MPGNEWALEEAKRNLINQYLLVGVTEEITNFISVLEAVIPSFFNGATKHFISSMIFFYYAEFYKKYIDEF